MKLYTSATSPYVRKVRVLMHEAGERQSELETQLAGGTPVDANTIPIDKNPLGKLPVLIDDMGHAIYDSRVICRYLNDYWQLNLYPSPPMLWRNLVLEATADGILDAAVLMVYEARVRPAPVRYADWIEGQWAKVARACAALEAQWLEDLQQPSVNMGQIATACALLYLDFRFPERDWRNLHPRLSMWLQEFAKRPSIECTQPVDQ